jgi:hypothetical protein
MPKTFVYVRTVVIEFLDTLPADHKVKGFDRLDDFAVEAEILKVYNLIVTKHPATRRPRSRESVAKASGEEQNECH